MTSLLRIAIVCGPFPSIADVWLLHQIAGLLDAGHDVRVLAIRDPGEALTQPEIEEYDLRHRTRYLGQLPGERRARFAHGALTLARFLCRHPDFLPRLAVRRYLKLHYLLNEVHWTAALVDTECDVLHVHIHHLMWHATLLYRLSPVPVVTTVHYPDLNSIPVGKCQDTFKWGDLFVAISRSYASWLVEQGCPAHKIALIPNGIDLTRFAQLPQRTHRDRTFRLLTVARMSRFKGLEYGLQAFAQLRQRLPGYTLSYAIAGEGPERSSERPSIERLVAELGGGDNVKLLGAVSNVEVSRLMGQADVFVLPSVAEGTPTVLMEAQAAGLPVVATAVGGVPEVVTDGQAGYLVPARDVPAIVDRLVTLATAPELRQRMGQAGRVHAQAHFDRRVCIARLVHHYRALANQPRGSYRVEQNAWAGSDLTE